MPTRFSAEKLVWLLGLLVPVLGVAQTTPRSPIQYVLAAPSGACGSSSNALQYRVSTGVLYGCVGSTWTAVTAGSSGVSGSGTTNTIAKFTASGTVGNSLISESGTVVTIGATGIVSGSSAASVAGVLASGVWFTGGSATTTKPHLLIEPSGTASTGWSTNGTGIGVNATSGAFGNLLDLQVAGVRKASVSTSGVAQVVAVSLGGETASFPAIGRTGTTVRIALADSSAEAPISASAFVATGGTPSVGTCGTIGTGSKNAAGFITSNVTGSCVAVLTFSGYTATTAWSCGINNATSGAGAITQTGKTTTSATFTGVTVSGDLLNYQCFPY